MSMWWLWRRRRRRLRVLEVLWGVGSFTESGEFIRRRTMKKRYPPAGRNVACTSFQCFLEAAVTTVA